MKDINVLIRRAVEEWEQRNREMPAAIMPDGYKGEYLYRVPAKKMQQVPDIGIPAIFVPAGDRLPWGGQWQRRCFDDGHAGIWNHMSGQHKARISAHHT